ncbi:amino acid ABC transporter substrate-binding protein [Aidingimonas lacisalsi]|uniref:amino acid ABC transporter substrate-binding protein n=1 Tax=Aidingimonas lacisalsi TaxID=2604086 RepID=UPI0011D1AD98|nr:amino acid ABC transporter substrate-binding protein [Aidingimonas lacisalsi]
MVIATLGPAGSNHELVLQRYLQAREHPEADIRLFDDFEAAFEALVAKQVDFVLQVTAHPSHADCVGRYMHRAFIVDTFIAASKPLALLRRTDIDVHETLGLQPATRYYTDLSDWTTQIEEPSIVRVGEGLLAGRYDAGITAQEFATQYPERLRIDKPLGAALDAWVLFSHRPLDEDVIVWPQAPVTRWFP